MAHVKEYERTEVKMTWDQLAAHFVKDLPEGAQVEVKMLDPDTLIIVKKKLIREYDE